MIKGIPQTGPTTGVGKQNKQDDGISSKSAGTQGSEAQDAQAKPLLSNEKTSLSTDALSETVKNAPDIDEQKITVIKDAILRGEYPLDTKKIAQAFLSLESVIN